MVWFSWSFVVFFVLFFNDTATPDIYSRALCDSLRCLRETGPGTVRRLLDLGVDPFNFGDPPLGVVAQPSLIHTSEPPRPY